MSNIQNMQDKFQSAFSALGFIPKSDGIHLGPYGMVKMDGQVPIAAAWLYPNDKLQVRAVANQNGCKEFAFNLEPDNLDQVTEQICRAIDFYINTTKTLTPDCIESAYQHLQLTDRFTDSPRQCDHTVYTDNKFAEQPIAARSAIQRLLNLSDAEIEYLMLVQALSIKAGVTDTRGDYYLKAYERIEALRESTAASLADKLKCEDECEDARWQPQFNPQMSAMLSAIDTTQAWANQRLLEHGIKRLATKSGSFPEVTLSDFYDDALSGYNVPEGLAEISKIICRLGQIRGVCDPMYICNVIAYETKAGDGCGEFHPQESVEYACARIDSVIDRLTRSYETSFTRSGVSSQTLKTHIEAPLVKFLTEHCNQRNSACLRSTA